MRSEGLLTNPIPSRPTSASDFRPSALLRENYGDFTLATSACASFSLLGQLLSSWSRFLFAAANFFQIRGSRSLLACQCRLRYCLNIPLFRTRRRRRA